ncbi:PilZ domain-containing protein [Bacillus sp. 31A1R]|uniref:PilZ domain-containing protein n=1 Tax=Robertmurraya mangrovi TaxID=3098077 RepID=A0ABU5ITT4_9BACI|nr:PilZ domain-containing protein [Bacillus sp. 31A1R]MDZ5470567.1 PilZ domain-containing protein [Bacillus sp. 31A1R]
MYKREEPFRFQFNQPLHGAFKILRINNISEESKAGTADILDLSPNGLRFKTKLNLPIDKKRFLIEITFLLNDKLIRILGEPKWKKIEGSSFVYGFTGLDDTETKKEVIEGLKEFTKKIYLQEKNK